MNSYTSLEPSFSQQLGITMPTFNAGTASVADSFSFLFTLGIMVIVVTGAGVLAYAGWERIQPSEQAVSKSNKIAKRAVLGTLGVVCLYVLIKTFNADLVTGDVGLDKLKVDSSVISAVVTKSATTTKSAPFIPKNNDDPAGWNAIRDDAAMRAQLAALPNGGISVPNKVCTTPTQTSCTTVGGWPAETPAMLAQLRNACSGGIAVTGGTEAGHKSHGPGNRPVDLSMNQPGNLNSCIQSFPKGPPLSFCYKTYQNFGYVFCDEISSTRHWHVQ